MENNKINSYQNEECMICLEPAKIVLSAEAELFSLHFDYKCIEKWLNTNKNILRACCVCDPKEIVNIINFDFSINQNTINQNTVNQNTINQNIYENHSTCQNNINNRLYQQENNNSFFSCCNIL